MYEISADWLNAISCVREMSQALFSLVGLTRVLFLCCTAVISHQWWSNQICILTFGALVAIAHVGSRQLIDWLLFSTQMMYRASAGAVLITGASRGMGRAASLHLAKSGFRVFAAVRRREDGEQLTRQATEAQCQGSIEVVVLDVCDDESVRTAAASIQKELADDCMPLVAVINNAGYMHLGPVEGVAVSAMRHTFDTNLFGVQRVCKAFAPLLRSTARDWLNASGNGALRPRLINISSIASFARAGYQGVYSSSKAAVDVLNEAMRQELEPHGVDVVLVSPYFIDSDMGAQWRDPAQRQAMIDELRREGVEGVYALATLSDTTLWSQVEDLTGIKMSAFAELIEHVCRVSDSDLRTQYFCGPPGLFLFPFVFAVLPERARSYFIQLCKPLVSRIWQRYQQN